MNLANTITLARLPLLVVIVIIFFVGSAGWRLASVPLVLLLIVMDGIDGIVARQRDEVTLLGSVLDIAADRAVEIILWVMYANLGLISWIIPVTVIIRGALTDSIREAGYQRGTPAFAAMRTEWGRWIVAGRPMRAAYGWIKALSFVLLASTLALQSFGSAWTEPVWRLGVITSWIALVFCIVRGIPVIVEAVTAERDPKPSLVEKGQVEKSLTDTSLIEKGQINKA